MALAAAAALTACSSDDGSTSAANDSTAAAKASAAASAQAEAAGPIDHVKIVKTGVEDHARGDNSYVVHYTITNRGAETADYFVSLDFLDKDGDTLGGTGVTANKLGVGKVHTGDTTPLEVEITNGKISDIKSVKVVSVERTPSAG
ncbi:hypothetical protein ABZ312_09805 [Streptomyces sp. NPDC006207]